MTSLTAVFCKVGIARQYLKCPSRGLFWAMPTLRFVEDGPYPYYQINRYQWSDGKQEEHQFPGTYRDKNLWFDTERIQGKVWEVDGLTSCTNYVITIFVRWALFIIRSKPYFYVVSSAHLTVIENGARSQRCNNYFVVFLQDHARYVLV